MEQETIERAGLCIPAGVSMVLRRCLLLAVLDIAVSEDHPATEIRSFVTNNNENRYQFKDQATSHCVMS